MIIIVAILAVFAIAVVIASSSCISDGSSAKDMAKMVPTGRCKYIHSLRLSNNA